MSKLVFQKVNAKYYDKKGNEFNVLHDLDFTLEDNQIIAFLGPSGCGKTTLLKCLLDSVDYDGTILLNGNDIEDTKLQNRRISYVSQNYALYPNMTIFDNIAFPLKMMNAPSDEIKRKVFEIAQELDITYLLSRKPRNISGGQQQRVAIARALVKTPSIFLLDEPCSNLDEENRSAAVELIKKSIKSHQAIAIYVTHNIKEALNIADMIYIMDDGNIVFKGTPEEVIDSDNEIIKSYFEEAK